MSNHRTYRLRVLLFLACAVCAAGALWFVSQVIGTLDRLDAVEAERDQWQDSAQVLAALRLTRGSVVADIGCGAGYFSLKLSDITGARGTVFAEDIRTLPLAFLRLRALLRHRTNIRIVHGGAADPLLPAGAFDAVLIANTFHEFDHPLLILAHVRRALRPGGRLVIIDRKPDATERHAIAEEAVETQLRAAGFEVIGRKDPFITPPHDEPWWLVTAATVP